MGGGGRAQGCHLRVVIERARNYDAFYIYYRYMEKKLYRSEQNAIISGVAGGIAEYYEMDPVIVRLIGIFIAIVTGIVPVALMYLLSVVVIPKRGMV